MNGVKVAQVFLISSGRRRFDVCPVVEKRLDAACAEVTKDAIAV